jgi:hypothetical protein
MHTETNHKGRIMGVSSTKLRMVSWVDASISWRFGTEK